MTGKGKYALVVANSLYDDALLRQLVAPSQDAEALSEVLASPDICGFEVQKLIDEPSYRICEKIEAFFDERERDDLALLYFSGHGITDDDGLLYYAGSNTQHKRLRSTAVAATWVNEAMTLCRSRRQVLLLDCCHSGAFARAKSASAVNIGPQLAGRTPEEGRGRFVLTASDSLQYSFEGDAVEGQGVYSVFTRAVVEGLRTGAADLDNDGLITLDELYSYVHRRVREQTPQQSPRKWESDAEGNLVIGLNRRPVPAALPEDLQAAIDSYVPEARLKAVERLDRLLRGKHRGIAIAAQETLQALSNDDSRRVSDAACQSLAAYGAELGSEQLAKRAVREQVTVAAQDQELEPESSPELERAREDQIGTAVDSEREQGKRVDVLVAEAGTRESEGSVEAGRRSESQESAEVPAETPSSIAPVTLLSASCNPDTGGPDAPELFSTIDADLPQASRGRLSLIVASVVIVCVAVFLLVRYRLPPQPVPVENTQPGEMQSGTQRRNPTGPTPAHDQLLTDQNAPPERSKNSNPPNGTNLRPRSPLVAASVEAEGGSISVNSGAPKVQATVPKRVNFSAAVASGMLIQKTEPVYPPIAEAAHVSGTVVLRAIISKSGSIEGLQIISGPAMLGQSALDAVRTWRYRPYLLNNEPVEVETTINVIFSTNQ
jgi:TonB family protein